MAPTLAFWRQVWLRSSVGGADGQSDRDAVPGAVGKARHRDRAQPRRNVSRRISVERRVGNVGGERNCRDGD